MCSPIPGLAFKKILRFHLPLHIRIFWTTSAQHILSPTSKMGFIDMIGRKLSGSRSNDGTSRPATPNSSSATNGSAEVRHIPPHVRNLSASPNGNARPPAVQQGTPGAVSSPNAGLGNVDLATTRNTKTAGNQPQPRRSNDIQNSTSPVQQTLSSISPPVSRLNGNSLNSRQAASNNTNGQRPNESSSSANNDRPRQQGTLQKQTSVASSLHSASGHPNGPNMRPNQQPAHGNNFGPPQGNPPKSAGRDTRRMEDSAYHAGFKDAVAQLEREREGQGGRGRALPGR